MWKDIIEAALPYILENALEIILSIVSLVVARYIVPFIKNDFIPWLKEKRLYNMVKRFVQATEKLCESGVIEKANKKNYVVALLEKNGVVVDETTEAFIESCVKELDVITSVIYEEVLEAEVLETEE